MKVAGISLALLAASTGAAAQLPLEYDLYGNAWSFETTEYGTARRKVEKVEKRERQLGDKHVNP